jgi:GNAT superfamily N-acetyltransferase
MTDFLIRQAQPEDAPLILTFIKELASYEKLEDHAVGTVEDIQKTLFEPTPKARVLIVEMNQKPAGFALYFYNYSTFLCRYGIYIEDIYVRETFRGQGLGKALLKHICQIAKEEGCGRVEWWCLDWNEPSIDFYLKLGAEPMSDWTVYRLDQSRIKAIAD